MLGSNLILNSFVKISKISFQNLWSLMQEAKECVIVASWNKHLSQMGDKFGNILFNLVFE